jgi:nucleotide-binding universal stress UspA family protein
MGAYGHSRVREAVFGGPTHDILAELTVPVLMAH